MPRTTYTAQSRPAVPNTSSTLTRRSAASRPLASAVASSRARRTRPRAIGCMQRRHPTAPRVAPSGVDAIRIAVPSGDASSFLRRVHGIAARAGGPTTAAPAADCGSGAVLEIASADSTACPRWVSSGARARNAQRLETHATPTSTRARAASRRAVALAPVSAPRPKETAATARCAMTTDSALATSCSRRVRQGRRRARPVSSRRSATPIPSVRVRRARRGIAASMPSA